MNGQVKAIVISLAPVLVLFTALLDPRISFVLAVVALYVLALCSRERKPKT